jgi:hypothetical protein
MWVLLYSTPSQYSAFISRPYYTGTPLAAPYQSWAITYSGGFCFAYAQNLSNTPTLNWGFTPSLSTLYHISYAYDNATVRYFVNGSQVGSNSVSGLIYGQDAGLSIGYESQYALANASRRLDGLIDDVRLYNRALSLAEIRLLASRRGIGLKPLPDRAAGLPRKLSVNVGGTWRAADAYVHNGTAFRLSEAKINVGGVWK